MAIALLIILINNPFAINDIGLQLSFLGTLGIVCFNKPIAQILSKKISAKKHPSDAYRGVSLCHYLFFLSNAIFTTVATAAVKSTCPVTDMNTLLIPSGVPRL